MTHSLHHQGELLQHQFGLRVAARLADGTADLPYDISERLRAARERAIAQRKVSLLQPVRVATVSGGVATLGFDGDRLGFWGRLASALPIVVLAAGLVTIHVVQNDTRAHELAEVDAALLTDDLPPAAYADPGFAQYLRATGDRAQ